MEGFELIQLFQGVEFFSRALADPKNLSTVVGDLIFGVSKGSVGVAVQALHAPWENIFLQPVVCIELA